MSDKAKSERYYLTNDYFKIMQDAWYNFAVNYHKTYMQMTESNFDFLCTYFVIQSNPPCLIWPENMLNKWKNKKDNNGNNLSVAFLQHCLDLQYDRNLTNPTKFSIPLE